MAVGQHRTEPLPPTPARNLDACELCLGRMRRQHIAGQSTVAHLYRLFAVDEGMVVGDKAAVQKQRGKKEALGMRGLEDGTHVAEGGQMEGEGGSRRQQLG